MIQETEYDALRRDLLGILPDVPHGLYDEAELFVRQGNPPDAFAARLCILSYIAGWLAPRE